jgi:hypothetical protein
MQITEKKEKKVKNQNQLYDRHVLAFFFTGVEADRLGVRGVRAGVPPDFDTWSKGGVKDLLIVVNGDKRGVTVAAELSLELAGVGGAVGAEVGLGSCVQLIALHVIAAVLVYGDLAIGVDDGEQFVEDGGDIVCERGGKEVPHHGIDEQQACYGWPHPSSRPALCTHLLFFSFSFSFLNFQCTLNDRLK